ncbi:MAG: hypothetical protein ACRENQ_10050 [Gemmatimonadaceae bacterium]
MTSTPACPTRMAFEHRFFMVALFAIFAVVVAGFARTYYLKAWFGTPALPWLVHLHGALMTSWFVLFFTQTCLIASHRVAWHRRLGVFGVGLAVAILVVAPIVLVHAVSRELHAPNGPQGLVVIFGPDLVVLTDFAFLVGSAITLRQRSDFHKRLMLLVTCSIILPAISRLPISALAGFGLFYACVPAPVVVDTARHRRLHPAFGWGAPLPIASQQLAFYAAHTHAWHAFVVRLFA